MTRPQDMPERCRAPHPITGRCVYIDYGEQGYREPPPQSDDAGVDDRDIIIRLNALLGVSEAQMEAMLAGSILGWSNLLAEPKYQSRRFGYSLEPDLKGYAHAAH